MKTSKFAAMAMPFLLAALTAPLAYAAPIVVLNGPQFATAVDNLNVDGTVYDVTFAASPVSQTFQGNSSGAHDAATGLLAALNGSTAVNIEGPAFSGNGFTIADNGTSGPLVVDFPVTPGSWSTTSSGGAPYAEFAAVPEPATLALFGAGLAGAGAMRRRRKLSS